MPSAEDILAQLRAKAASLRGLGYRVRVDLTDCGDSILIGPTGAAEACEADAEADTVLAISAENLGKMAAGKLSPMLAFTMGKLRVEGSKGVAMKLASLLDED